MTDPAARPTGAAPGIAPLRAELADIRADRQRHVEALGRLQADMVLVRQEVSALRSENLHLRNVVAQAGDAVAAPLLQHAVCLAELDRMRGEVASLRAENARLRGGSAGLRVVFWAAYSSLLWRISAAARAIHRLSRPP